MLSFITYYLVKNPEAMRKLREEIDEKIGDRPMSVKDINQLPYLLGKSPVRTRTCISGNNSPCLHSDYARDPAPRSYSPRKVRGSTRGHCGRREVCDSEGYAGPHQHLFRTPRPEGLGGRCQRVPTRAHARRQV